MFFNIEKKLQDFKKELNDSMDVSVKVIETLGTQKIGLIYLKSMIDNQLFMEGVCKPLTLTKQVCSLDEFKSKLINLADVKIIKENEVIENIVKGTVILCIESEKQFLAIDIQKYPASCKRTDPCGIPDNGHWPVW